MTAQRGGHQAVDYVHTSIRDNTGIPSLKPFQLIGELGACRAMQVSLVLRILTRATLVTARTQHQTTVHSKVLFLMVSFTATSLVQ